MDPTRVELFQAIITAPPHSLPISDLSVVGPGEIYPSWTVEPTQQQLDLFASLLAAFDFRPHKPRTVLAIRNDINALSNAKKTAIWNDLHVAGGAVPKWTLYEGSSADAMAAIYWSATVPAGVTAAEKVQAQILLVAMYCRGNPRYLVNPAFDPAINIPGEEPVV